MKYEDIKTPKELLDFMKENIKYGFVSNTGKVYDNPNSIEWENDWYSNCIVQDGESLLKTKYGTCWDQVEFERKWFLEHNYIFKTIFIWFEVNKPNNLPTHTFLIYEENNRYFWFEHSFYDYRGIHEFESYEDAIEYVKKEQLKYTVNSKLANTNDYKYIVAYEFSKPLTKFNVDDYISHVTKNKI